MIISNDYETLESITMMNNIEELKEKDILYKTIVGSQAYGTNTENSDVDIKGIFWIDHKKFLTLNPPVTPQMGQINDEKHNITFYSIYRTLELLKDANPNFIELLWMPEDCILYKSDILTPLFESRNMFITRMAYKSHASYAYSQIKKAKGKNKKVHNPQPETMPSKLDFCKVIPLVKNYEYKTQQVLHGNASYDYFPYRPINIKETDIDLSKCHVASLEHTPNVYRLYYYGDKAKGVFRGNDMLVCESIPKEDEWENIIGLLIYSENEFEKYLRDWRSYWEWKKNSNPNRWKSQEGGIIDYDVKNMQHCFRLIYSGFNILTNGEPIVRFESKKLQFLKDIRDEKYTYDELMNKLSCSYKEMEEAYEKCKLPDCVDSEKLELLYKELMNNGINHFSC